MADVHALFLAALKDFDEAADLIQRGVNNQDIFTLNAVIDLLVDGSELSAQADELLIELIVSRSGTSSAWASQRIGAGAPP